MRNLKQTFMLITTACVFASTTLGQTPFSSGSSGAQGVFPPVSIAGANAATLVIDLKTGVVSAIDSSGAVAATATLPGGDSSGDKFPTGELDFTTFTTIGTQTLRFSPNSQNTPITIRVTGDVLINGNIDISGKNGADINSALPVGGKGGPGGFEGGAAGTPSTGTLPQSVGRYGLGRNGGAGGVLQAPSSAPFADYGQGAAFPHTNANLLPLTGGSGGGGGRGGVNSMVNTGGGGGGGGGAILIASSTKIVLNQATINAKGGAGGGNTSCQDCGKPGGGGSGGAIRLISNRIEMGGILLAGGGATGLGYESSEAWSKGAAGIIRVEAHDLVNVGSPTINPAPSIGVPSAIRPPDLPRLRITSIGGTAVPDLSFSGTVDVTISSSSSAAANPMPVVVQGISVPNGTTIIVKSFGSFGDGTNFNSVEGTLASGTVTVNLTIAPGVSYVQAATAQFTVSAELQRELPLYKGEQILTAAVEFDGAESHVSFFTGSGMKVGMKELFGLD